MSRAFWVVSPLAASSKGFSWDAAMPLLLTVQTIPPSRQSEVNELPPWFFVLVCDQCLRNSNVVGLGGGSIRRAHL